MVLTFRDYEKIAGIMNYFGVEFLKISFYLILFVKMEFFRQKERIQVIKYIYLFKKKKKIKTETEAGAHLSIPLYGAKHPFVQGRASLQTTRPSSNWVECPVNLILNHS